jgi:hypothetical protein
VPTAAPPVSDGLESPANRPATGRLTHLFSNFELVIVVLLGLVSVATAYVSFQAALYDSPMAGAYTKGQNARTTAESMYLEANQQYIRDVAVWSSLTDLSIDMDSPDPALAQVASHKFDTLYFQSVDEELAAAITWSAEQNDATPDEYASPFESEDYIAARFAASEEMVAEADALVADGDTYNSLSDRLTLNTVLMALSLFLLGIAAVVRGLRSQLVLTAVATGIFILSAVLTTMIPFVAI